MLNTLMGGGKKEKIAYEKPKNHCANEVPMHLIPNCCARDMSVNGGSKAMEERISIRFMSPLSVVSLDD